MRTIPNTSFCEVTATDRDWIAHIASQAFGSALWGLSGCVRETFEMATTNTSLLIDAWTDFLNTGQPLHWYGS
jgi:hypothetical protein